MLAICLCFKDSASYLDEWLRFHYAQGFRKFYLYDNGSSDNWSAVADPWIEKGLVEAREYLGAGVQQAIYDDCLSRAAGEVGWLAFLDDDEFLLPLDETLLADRLEDYRDHAGVAVSWRLFGSGEQERGSDSWVIERFRRRHPSPSAHVKCVVRPERILRSKVIGHAFEAKPGYELVDENFIRLSEPMNPAPSASKLGINHYLVKSWEEWRERRTRPQANTGVPTPFSEAEWREWDKSWSSTEDVAACRFLSAMRSIDWLQPLQERS